PPIEQAVIAELLVAFTDAPQMTVTEAHNLCCLPPGDLPRPGPQHHFLYFHRPLHGGLRVREHAQHVLLLSPPRKRTYHVLIRPDISCANDNAIITSGAARLVVLTCFRRWRSIYAQNNLFAQRGLSFRVRVFSGFYPGCLFCVSRALSIKG